MFASHYDKIKKTWSGPRQNDEHDGKSAGEILLAKMTQSNPNRVVQVNLNHFISLN